MFLGDHVKRASEILREGGPMELLKAMFRFLRQHSTIKEFRTNLYTHKRNILNNMRFDAVASPFDPIDVEPRKINWYTSKVPVDNTLGQVLGGKWDQDQNLMPIEQHW